MVSETTDKIFRYIIENPDCTSSEIAKKVGSNAQIVNYHLGLLVNKGLVIKNNAHGVNVYSCSVNEDKVKELLVEMDASIDKIFTTISSSMIDKTKAKEVTKQIISAYIDALLD